MRATSIACAAIGAAATAIVINFAGSVKHEREHGREQIQVPYKLEPDDCDGCREDCPWFNTEHGFEGCNKVAREEKTCNKVAREEKTCDGCFFIPFDNDGGVNARCYMCSRQKRDDLWTEYSSLAQSRTFKSAEIPLNLSEREFVGILEEARKVDISHPASGERVIRGFGIAPVTCERCKFGGRPGYKYPCYKCRHFSRFEAKDGEH